MQRFTAFAWTLAFSLFTGVLGSILFEDNKSGLIAWWHALERPAFAAYVLAFTALLLFFRSLTMAPARLLGSAFYPDAGPRLAYFFALPLVLRCLGMSIVSTRRPTPEVVRRWIETTLLLDPRYAREPGTAPRAAANHAWRGVRKQLMHAPSRAIPVSNPGSLRHYEIERRMKNYLEATASPGLADAPGSFTSSVEISEAFIAPLHLLAGVLAHFHHDWKPVIDRYGKDLATQIAADRKMSGGDDHILWRQQAFGFYCWLLWGPSVPVCKCPVWDGHLIIQCGYGDENNSFPLFVEQAAIATQLPRSWFPLAHQVMPVTVVPALGTTIDQIPAPQAPVADEIALRCKSTGMTISAQNARLYYSAYLWIIFEICDESGEAICPRPAGDPDSSAYREALKNRWRSLFPFFEHTNIADDIGFSQMKVQLIRRSLATLRDIGGGFHFRYLCAVDDPGPGTDHELRGGDTGGAPARKLSDILRDEIANQPDLRRVSVPDISSPQICPASELPQAVHAFLGR